MMNDWAEAKNMCIYWLLQTKERRLNMLSSGFVMIL